MCGRYAHRRPDAEIWRRRAPGLPPTAPRYNVAPGTDCLVFTHGDGVFEPALMRWGFAPAWMRDSGRTQVNARAETVLEKPMFRDSFRKRRCLVPADGWYEWARDGDTRQPWFFQLTGAAPFALAGLWTPGHGPDGPATFAVLTTEPNRLAAQVHARMPVVLRERDWDEWLDDHPQGPGRLQFLCRTWHDAPLEAWPVSASVNRPQYTRPDCVEPTGPVIR